MLAMIRFYNLKMICFLVRGLYDIWMVVDNHWISNTIENALEILTDLHLLAMSRSAGPMIGGTILEMTVSNSSMSNYCSFDGGLVLASKLSETIIQCSTPETSVAATEVQVCEDIGICSLEIFNFEGYDVPNVKGINTSYAFALGSILLTVEHARNSNFTRCVFNETFTKVTF